MLTALSYLVHLVATLLWFGWSVLAVMVSPLDSSSPMTALFRRMTPLALVAFAALGGSGLYQLAKDPHYVDLLALTNTWSQLMFVKHVLYAAEALVLAFYRLNLEPELRLVGRAAARGRSPADTPALVRRHTRLARLNLALSLAILILTAWITAIPDPPYPLR